MRALNQPESWWGWHGYSQPQPMSITEIIHSGAMPSRIAAVLWLAVERGQSVILAADPPGAGKTTILTALLAFARPDASVYFTHGWGETFNLPPKNGDAPIYMLINEISDHLPVYSWGPYVQRAFELMSDGYSLASTMHADTVEGVIEQLTDENDVEPRYIGNLSFVITMFVGAAGGRRLRRVSEVAILEPLADGYDRESIARWHRDEDRYDVLTTPSQIDAAARRLGMPPEDFLEALTARAKFLDTLLAENVTDIEEVQRRVFDFRGYTVAD